MFLHETAVIGVIASNGSGVVRSCLRCRSASRDRSPCGGFGPGCLVPPRPQEAAWESSSRRFERA